MIFDKSWTSLFTQLAVAGTTVRRGSWTRRQSSPSSKACSWAALSRITPSRTVGQRNWPFSRRLATSTTRRHGGPRLRLDPLNHRRYKHCRQHRPGSPGQPAPREQLLRRQPVTARDGTDRLACPVALDDDRRLLLARPTSPPARTREHFNAPDRLRHMLML